MMKLLTLLILAVSTPWANAQTWPTLDPDTVRGPDHVYQLVEGRGSVWSAALSPDGRYAAVIHVTYPMQHMMLPGQRPDRSTISVFRLIDLDTGQETTRFEFPPEMVKAAQEVEQRTGVFHLPVDMRQSVLALSEGADRALFAQQIHSEAAQDRVLRLWLYDVKTQVIAHQWEVLLFADDASFTTTLETDPAGKYVDVLEHGPDAWSVTRLSLKDLSILEKVTWPCPQPGSKLLDAVVGLDERKSHRWSRSTRNSSDTVYHWNLDQQTFRLLTRPAARNMTGTNVWIADQVNVLDLDLRQRQLIRQERLGEIASDFGGIQYLGMDPLGRYAWIRCGKYEAPRTVIYDIESGEPLLDTRNANRPVLIDWAHEAAMIVEHKTLKKPANAQANRTIGYLRRWSLPDAKYTDPREVEINWPAAYSTLALYYPPQDQGFLRHSADGKRTVNFVNGQARVIDWD